MGEEFICCPICGSRSSDPSDVSKGYCARCHAQTNGVRGSFPVPLVAVPLRAGHVDALACGLAVYVPILDDHDEVVALVMLRPPRGLPHATGQ